MSQLLVITAVTVIYAVFIMVLNYVLPLPNADVYNFIFKLYWYFTWVIFYGLWKNVICVTPIVKFD